MANNNAVIEALQQYGSLPEEEIINILTWNSGPDIYFTPLSSIHTVLGRFNGLPSDYPEGFLGPNAIELNSYTFDEIEEQLENGSEFNPETLTFFLAIIILHEATHYGDFHYNGNLIQLNGGETRFDFETSVIGTQVDYPETISTLQEYLLIRN